MADRQADASVLICSLKCHGWSVTTGLSQLVEVDLHPASRRVDIGIPVPLGGYDLSAGSTRTKPNPVDRLNTSTRISVVIGLNDWMMACGYHEGFGK